MAVWRSTGLQNRLSQVRVLHTVPSRRATRTLPGIHKDISVTLGIYTALDKKFKKKKINRLDTYLKLCGFVLFFRMLAAGAGEVLPSGAGVFCAMLLEVCSGCDLAAKSGRFASMLCCAALSVQGLSVLMQVRTICPPEMTLRPLYRARLLHLPLSLLVFYLLLPQRAQETFSTLCGRVTMMRRLPPDCALLVFLGCCFVVCELSRVFAKEPNQTQGDKVANQS